MTHTIVARLDSAGDVLLAGPAIRAVAAGSGRVTMLAGPRGRAAAALLPGPTDVRVIGAPWIDPEPGRVDRRDTLSTLRMLARLRADRAVIFTSFHQSALPLALLLRLAGVPFIAAISEDYPGSLLDVRHRVGDDIHEVERALSLAAAAGYPLPAGDDGRLAVVRSASAARLPWDDFVVVHPGSDAPARAWAPEKSRALVAALAGAGRNVVVTGGRRERALGDYVAGPPGDRVVNLAGELAFPGLVEVVARAGVAVVGNTGPAHVAAAVGTPVVSLFPPTVPNERWHPWRVPHVTLGRQDVPCAGCRARICPVPGQPCLADVTIDDVVGAIEKLTAEGMEARV